MRAILVVGALTMFLTACNGQSAVNTAFPKYVNKPVSGVTQKWGQPDRSIRADGGTIYQWQAKDARGICRLEVHAANPLNGNGEQKIIGVRGVGEDDVCASWFRLLE